MKSAEEGNIQLYTPSVYLNKQWVNNISELQKCHSPVEVLLEVEISSPPYFKAPEVLGNSSTMNGVCRTGSCSG
jgi:hypothetical protein